MIDVFLFTSDDMRITSLNTSSDTPYVGDTLKIQCCINMDPQGIQIQVEKILKISKLRLKNIFFKSKKKKIFHSSQNLWFLFSVAAQRHRSISVVFNGRRRILLPIEYIKCPV